MTVGLILDAQSAVENTMSASAGPATRSQPLAASASQSNPRTPPCEQSTCSQSNTPTNITPTTSMYCESHNTPVLLQTA